MRLQNVCACVAPHCPEALPLQHKGVCHTVALPFTLKSILRQNKNYGNSNNFTMQKHNLEKNPPKETQNPSR
jgi:hypothetical protein